MAHVYDSLPVMGMLTASDQHRYRQEGLIEMPRYGVMDAYYQSPSGAGLWSKKHTRTEHWPDNPDRGFLDPEREAIIRYEALMRLERNPKSDPGYERRRRVTVVATFLRTAPEYRKNELFRRVRGWFNIYDLYYAIQELEKL